MKTSSSLFMALAPLALSATPTLASVNPVPTVDYLYSRYQEADIKGDKTASGRDEERYTIDSHRFRINLPATDRDSFGVNLIYESMSGASSWFVIPNAEGKPVQVMSGASIHEERIAIQGDWRHEWSRLSTFKLSGGYSNEDDYRSLQVGLEGAWASPNQMQTLTVGVAYSADTVMPTGGGSAAFPTRIVEADRDGITAFASLEQLLGPRTRVQLAISGLWQEGFLSDPYKLAFITNSANTVADSRPDQRNGGAVSMMLRHSLGQGFAAQADYRYYQDNWEVEAHSLVMGLLRSQGNWQWAANARWYSQSQAGFYAPFYATERTDGLATSDYRLSPFGALSFGLDVKRLVGPWALGAGLGWYKASEDFALGKVEVANPGLVSWLNGHVRVTRSY
ncbi:MAG: DUF3570 domain-containing protein [Moraxellaceae bacterium]|nr:DUF3570 domain-containing protein [Moraxellaceae bacterium]MDZ4387801.1 DUF3570 domain-containing protein [Moraxellaceae bacterium]